MSAALATDLSGCAAKLRRALFHMQDLDQRALRFIYEVNPYLSVVDFDADTGENVIRLQKDVDQPPIDEWSPIVGDVAHNLMSALDHLVCQLHIRNGENPECWGTQFPIFDIDNARSQEKIRGYIGTLADDDQRIIRELQPYQRGNRDLARADPLWLLRTMNVIDKHRRMHLVSSGILRDAPLFVAGYTVTDLTVSEGTKAGDEILRFRAVQHPDATEQDTNAQVLVVISFGPSSGALAGRSVRSELPAIFLYIRDHIFPKFEHRVGRLPPVGDIRDLGPPPGAVLASKG